MKTTIDIPEDLYRRVKARSALLGKRVRDVTIELYQRWLEEVPMPSEQTQEQWLDEWLRLGREALAGGRSGPSASEVLARDRRRLEPR